MRSTPLLQYLLLSLSTLLLLSAESSAHGFNGQRRAHYLKRQGLFGNDQGQSSSTTTTTTPTATVTVNQTATVTETSTTSGSVSGTTTTTTTSAPSASCSGALGELICGLSSLLDGTTTTTTTTSVSGSTTTTTTTTTVATTTSASDPSLGDSTTTAAPTTTTTTTTTTAAACSASGILGQLGCTLSSVFDPTTTTTTTTTSTSVTTTTSVGSGNSTTTTTTTAPTTTTSASPTCSGGILSDLECIITSAIGPTGTSNTTTSAPTTTTTSTCDPLNPLCFLTTSTSTSTPSGNGTTTSVGQGTFTTTTTTGIVWPSGNTTTTTATGTATSTPLSTIEITSQTTNATVTASVNSQFNFLTTATALALSSVTGTGTLSLTNPDQPTTTLSSEIQPSAAALPSGLASRIFPQNATQPGSPETNGQSLISILLNNDLGWEFVNDNQTAATEILAFMPPLLSLALDIPSSQVLEFALQVFIPNDYQGPQNASLLDTIWIGWIPSDLVNNLAQQLKDMNSPIYTQSTGILQQLAFQINTAYALDSISESSLGSGNGSPVNNATTSSASSDTRQNAIIGVVSAMGAVALLVLGVLVYRSFKRRQELAHHRLSGPEVFIGARPEGREFDEDSIGGQRRRSFYYAEDSLRGYEQAQQAAVAQAVRGGESLDNPFADRNASPQMGQRIDPAAISHPILQQSSMNW